ncbi:hypothetical protein [Xylanibacillus composti]|uniref:hypothetical protein n=1 Tax=Xylanibacillus composti TaxID=1572762 RepID=UPI001BCC227A|nr:hypothetical protein [Xylanibacillus composti]
MTAFLLNRERQLEDGRTFLDKDKCVSGDSPSYTSFDIDQREIERIVQASDGGGLWKIRKHLKSLHATGIQFESPPGSGTCGSFAIPVNRREAANC